MSDEMETVRRPSLPLFEDLMAEVAAAKVRGPATAASAGLLSTNGGTPDLATRRAEMIPTRCWPRDPYEHLLPCQSAGERGARSACVWPSPQPDVVEGFHLRALKQITPNLLMQHQMVFTRCAASIAGHGGHWPGGPGFPQ